MQSTSTDKISLNRDRLVGILDACLAIEDLVAIRQRVTQLQDTVGLVSPGQISSEGATVQLRKDVLLADLTQILETHTLKRTHYYLARLRRGATEVRTSKINDINLNRWKEYDAILTDSLWVMARRDTSGAHKGWYWGNFIPQIPHQMLRRYTKRGDWVVDTFAGSGTTLIECRRLGRNGLGIELNPEVAAQALTVVEEEANPDAVITDIVAGDCTAVNYAELLAARGSSQVQLLIMHPPYHDIIRFGDDERDLSNAATLDDFVALFSQVVVQTYPILEKGRYLVVVIGDKYVKGEWVPLGFHLMQAVLAQGYTLKSIIVKNFEETRAKRDQKALWRYRALVGGFYVFRHEYILLFRK